MGRQDSEAQRPLLSKDGDGDGEKCSAQTPSPSLARRALFGRSYLLSGVFLTFGLLLVLFAFCDSRFGPFLQPWSAKPGAKHSGDADRFLLGVGKADITGPVVEINFMGYADPNQVGSGLRQRLYSRAFIVGDLERPAERFVYLVLDTQSGDTAVRYGIISALHALGPEYAELYGHHNIAVTGTHSHSGPGGWLNYLLPQITSKGFDHQGYQAIVDGAVLSIHRAHESLAPGYLSVGQTKVLGANINRSLFAYLANPEAERARYNISTDDDGSVEKEMTLLRFSRASDLRNIGILTWFPTHGTSMLGNNTLVTGDNKGVAAYLFERSMRDHPSAAPDQPFVAGFSQASVGDTSPNILGAWCEDGSGVMCSFENSTCPLDGSKARSCHARGPFFSRDDGGTASCFEIGRRQYEPARRLYDEDVAPLSPLRGGDGGRVRSFHTFHNMSGFEFPRPDSLVGGDTATNSSLLRTCPAALGYSFAAGTSDGPGVFDFTQHDGDPSNTSPVWQVVSHMLKEPSEEQQACHGAKPILLDVGEVSRPYEWTPNIVDVQVLRAGRLIIIVSPGEATTMAGRRWKDAVRRAYADLVRGDEAPVVVLGGPANSYTHYITTEEEYGVQRYEGASTLYGPHTLNAYINVTLSYLPHLLSGSNGDKAPSGPPTRHDPDSLPPDNTNRSLSFITGVVRDGPKLFKSFGDVLEDVDAGRMYWRGRDAPRAVFVGANPRNNLRLEETFAAVEKKEGGRWVRVRDDADWSLVFRWRRTSGLLGTSEVEIQWEVEDWTDEGVYRLRYYGDSKGLNGDITPFDGVSEEFNIVG
ncbi:hypothetical protein MAPG_05362 [Magnaporthiopsis poae ATCC 64411]|uniref:Neutral ceramidase n=1 Tax=Magnaporthiopsis poae (strain ATCC 64411 / 73-15) TaxID=644358 RepID=A0A0C4DZ73_MAGP6|nr:hypothetical protein MAPG_05362 [Magnaporthiopsis poae ATCC 64411]